MLELLVALSIFAVISVMAYGGLRSVLDVRGRTERQAAELAEIQLAFTIVQRDIEQAVARGIRDNYGVSGKPDTSAMLGEEEGEPLLELTRSGWRNPAGQRRSTLQRVAYNVTDGHLVRSTWNVLDRAQNSEPQKSRLLGGVNSATIEFIQMKNKKLDPKNSWPVTDQLTNPGLSGIAPPPSLPQALRLTVDLKGWGSLTRLFRIVETPSPVQPPVNPPPLSGDVPPPAGTPPPGTLPPGTTPPPDDTPQIPPGLVLPQ